MSTLEHDVRPILTGARRGRIEADEAQLLARWFGKTAVALNVSMPFRLLFDARTRHTLRTGVPANVRVFLAIVRRRNGYFDWMQTTASHVVAPEALDPQRTLRGALARAYVAMIRIDQLVGTVAVMPPELVRATPDSAARQIWPVVARPPTWGALPRVRDLTGAHVGWLMDDDQPV
jgi:hypothetical protein